jgi:cytochrome c nitrite reductase small subunit
MGPVLESVMSDDGSLAATHIANATIPVTQGCYTCHSGYGIWGTVGAKSAGVIHMLHTVTGNYDYPLKTTGQFDIGSCLNCHSRGKKFRAAAPHQDPSIAKLLLEGTMSCAGTCHPAAHPESALMGAEAK